MKFITDFCLYFAVYATFWVVSTVFMSNASIYSWGAAIGLAIVTALISNHYDGKHDKWYVLLTENIEIAIFRKWVEMKTFILSEADIQSIINGRDVIKQDGDSKILIRQSYAKDIVAPIINDRFIVSDSETKNCISNAMNDIRPNLYKMGYWPFFKNQKNNILD